MSTFGLIFCAYQSEDFLTPGPNCTLQSWVDLRARLAPHKLVIAAVCVPFEGFDHGGVPDRTEALLTERLERGHIDILTTSKAPLKETEARGRALSWLRDVAKVDYLWQADSDELFHERDIKGIVDFVEAQPLVPTFRISYRNAVFNRDTFLVDPFTPMRIHRVRSGTYEAYSFWDDNNVLYRGTLTRDFKRDDYFSCLTIPFTVAFPTHLSWLNDERSRRKIAYQEHRWGPPNGNGCSFAWDESRGGLVWNADYFKRTGQPIPEIVTEYHYTLADCRKKFEGIDGPPFPGLPRPVYKH